MKKTIITLFYIAIVVSIIVAALVYSNKYENHIKKERHGEEDTIFNETTGYNPYNVTDSDCPNAQLIEFKGLNESQLKTYFDEGSFCIKITDEETDGNYDKGQTPELNNFGAIEIIGNIYENPNLLTFPKEKETKNESEAK